MKIVVRLKSSDQRKTFEDATMEQDDWAVYITQYSKYVKKVCIFSKSDIQSILQIEKRKEE